MLSRRKMRAIKNSICCGFEDARNEIIVNSLDLASDIALQFVDDRFTYDELLSEAYMALTEAAYGYDVYKSGNLNNCLRKYITYSLSQYVIDVQKDENENLSFEDSNAQYEFETDVIDRMTIEKTINYLSSKYSYYDSRKEYILRSLYGFGEELKTVKELSNELNISVSYIGQIVRRFLHSIEACLEYGSRFDNDVFHYLHGDSIDKNDKMCYNLKHV